MELVYQPAYAASGLTLLIAFCSSTSIRRLILGKQCTKLDYHDAVAYEDEDGVASEESIAQFSNKAQFITIFALAFAALGLSAADAIFTVVHRDLNLAHSGTPLLGVFLLFPSWVNIYAHSLGLN